MNLVKSVQPLLTIFGLDDGRETAVVTIPLPILLPICETERVVAPVTVVTCAKKLEEGAPC